MAGRALPGVTVALALPPAAPDRAPAEAPMLITRTQSGTSPVSPRCLRPIIVPSRRPGFRSNCELGGPGSWMSARTWGRRRYRALVISPLMHHSIAMSQHDNTSNA